MRASQRRDFSEFAAGLTAWIRGEDSERADAAAENVATVLTIYLKQNLKDE